MIKSKLLPNNGKLSRNFSSIYISLHRGTKLSSKFYIELARVRASIKIDGISEVSDF